MTPSLNNNNHMKNTKNKFEHGLTLNEYFNEKGSISQLSLTKNKKKKSVKEKKNNSDDSYHFSSSSSSKSSSSASSDNESKNID